MLHLIRGRAGSGKTEYIRGLIGDMVSGEENDILLIVPEQFSFESERRMLKALGAKNMKHVSVYSFSRLSMCVLKEQGKCSQSFLDAGTRLVLMSEALETLSGRLSVFAKASKSEGALKSLVDLNKELKFGNIPYSSIADASKQVESSVLCEKLTELALINETYDALTADSYFDDSNAVAYFNDYALESDWFAGKTVFVDAFRAFSGQELECITLAIAGAKDVYITLCTDTIAPQLPPFSFMNDFENRMKTAAREHNVKIALPVNLSNENSFSGDIAFVEKNIFSDEPEKALESDGSVVLARCADIEDECRFVACEIKKLLRTGEYRCRDIAVIERVSGTYKRTVTDMLKRFGVPVFDDSRRPLKFEALFIYVSAALECVAKAFKTESVMRCLKTGVSPLTLSEISELEKYALVWGIGGLQWLNDFTMHPEGFGRPLDDKAKTKLAYINKLRKKAIFPLIDLKKKCTDTNGAAIARAVYEFIDETGVRKKLLAMCEELISDGFPVEAEREEASWNSLTELLNTMYDLYSDKAVSLSRWRDMFELLVSSKDIGVIPEGLDKVTVGSADRIRTEQLKAVFLVGVNKNEFPLISIRSGVLSDSDRRVLTELGVGVRPPFEDAVPEEQFIVYCALTAASEKLYLSYRTCSGEDSADTPSELIEDIKNMIPGVKAVSSEGQDIIESIESEESAFSVLSKCFNDNTPLRATLYEYFKNNDKYKGRLKAVESALNKTSVSFTNPAVSTELFGKNLRLSASRIENYYNCPFGYFCRFGLLAEPLNAAALDPSQSGTVIHYILEKVLGKYKENLTKVADSELKEYVSSILSDYLEENMGGFKDKSKRFMFLFERFIDISMTVISRLKEEFSSCDFKPCDFELKIGGDKIPAYSLKLPDDGTVSVTGSVDRVDMLEKDGIKYLRVIDYKTGAKGFKLSKLLDGLNIQMVLYLLTLEKNGKHYYGETLPAGVLYLPSRIGVSSYLKERAPSDEAVEAQKRVGGKLSGMVLNSPVVFNGMGVDKMPDYFPVSYKKDETAGNTFTLKQFNELSKVIDGKITDMAVSLKAGKIPALPCGSSGKASPCEYCAYRAVCGFESGDSVRELTSYKHAEVLKILDGEDNEQTVD